MPGEASPSKALRFAESPGGDWRLFEWPDAPAPELAEDPGPWTMALLFRREVISLGQLQDPRREFVFAANTGRPGQLPPPATAPTTPADEAASA